MKESLSEQEEVSTRSRRARKRVQDSNFVFIWFWIPELWIYLLLAKHVQGTFDEDKHENQMFSLSIVYWFFYYLRSDSQQTTKKARYDAICVQECPNFKVTRPSFFGGVPSYFEALWYPHLYFYRKSNT